MAMTTGTAVAMSLLPIRGLVPARTAATAGTTSAMAPIVAIHPPSTDIQDVAGRTTTAFIHTLLEERSRVEWCKTLASPSPGSRLGERCLRACRLGERLGEVGLLPWKIRSPEVAVRRGLT